MSPIWYLLDTKFNPAEGEKVREFLKPWFRKIKEVAGKIRKETTEPRQNEVAGASRTTFHTIDKDFQKITDIVLSLISKARGTTTWSSTIGLGQIKEILHNKLLLRNSYPRVQDPGASSLRSEWKIS